MHQTDGCSLIVMGRKRPPWMQSRRTLRGSVMSGMMTHSLYPSLRNYVDISSQAPANTEDSAPSHIVSTNWLDSLKTTHTMSLGITVVQGTQMIMIYSAKKEGRRTSGALRPYACPTQGTGRDAKASSPLLLILPYCNATPGKMG